MSHLPLYLPAAVSTCRCIDLPLYRPAAVSTCRCIDLPLPPYVIGRMGVVKIDLKRTDNNALTEQRRALSAVVNSFCVIKCYYISSAAISGRDVGV